MSELFSDKERDLIDRLVDGVASRDDFARAQALLSASSEARRHFVEKKYLIAALEKDGARRVPPIAEVLTVRRRPSRRIAVVGLAAALGAGLAACLFVLASGRTGSDTAGRDAAQQPGALVVNAEPSRASDEAMLARLVVADAPRFEGDLRPIDGDFRPGEYRLAEGAVSLRFNNGVALTVEAPADFELVHEKLVSLHRGKARARVPESGVGFVIAAPGVDIEDLGTEFGVLVEPDRTTALHVFTGAVELHREGRASVQLVEDSTTMLRDGLDLARHDGAEIEFPTLSQVAHQQWRAFSEKLRRDPAVVVYYDFEQNPLRPDVLQDRAARAIPVDGVVRGGHWASGRWPRKGSLFFDHDGDCVEVDIPGEYDAFTLHTWIRVNRLESPKQSIFGVHGWDRPGLHKLDLHNTGELAFAVRGDSPEFRVYRTPVGTMSVGAWTHLAAVVDRMTQVATYYKDGQQILSVPVSGEFPLVFGPSIIGGFEHRRANAWPYHLQFRGWIDELAVFSRALSPEEVGEIYEQGRCFD